MKILLLDAVLFLTPRGAVSLPYNDGIVSVADREFFVGELSQSFGQDVRSFDFRHSPWLKEILDNDPLLWDPDVRFLRTGVPAIELIGESNQSLWCTLQERG